jgi:hypothetical protein
MAVVFGHDFRQVRRQSGSRYKYREGRSQRIGDNQLRRRQGRIHGAQPTAKAAPDLCGVIDGQVLQQTLRDTAELDMDVAGTQFSPHAGPVLV